MTTSQAHSEVVTLCAADQKDFWGDGIYPWIKQFDEMEMQYFRKWWLPVDLSRTEFVDEEKLEPRNNCMALDK